MFIPPGEDQKNGLVDPFLLTTNPWSPWAPGIPEPVLAGTSTTATVANIAKPPVMDMAMSKTYKSPKKKLRWYLQQQQQISFTIFFVRNLL